MYQHEKGEVGSVVWFCSKFHTLPTVQKFWKSVNIWQSYRECKGGNFLKTQCILRITEDLEIGNWVETRLNCQLSCPCRRCEQAIKPSPHSTSMSFIVGVWKQPVRRDVSTTSTACHALTRQLSQTIPQITAFAGNTSRDSLQVKRLSAVLGSI